MGHCVLAKRNRWSKSSLIHDDAESLQSDMSKVSKWDHFAELVVISLSMPPRLDMHVVASVSASLLLIPALTTHECDSHKMTLHVAGLPSAVDQDVCVIFHMTCCRASPWVAT